MEDVLNSIENLIEITNKLFSLLPDSLLTSNIDESQRAVIMAKMRTNQKITEVIDTENKIQIQLNQLSRMAYKLPEVEKGLSYAYSRVNIIMENVTKVSLKLAKLEEEVNSDIMKNNIIDDFGQDFDEFRAEMENKSNERDYKLKELETSVDAMAGKLIKMEIEIERLASSFKQKVALIDSINNVVSEMTMYKIQKI